MHSIFFSAVGLGLAFSAMPGAIMAEALRRGASAGTRPVVLLRLGGLVSSVAWATATMAGVGVLARTEVVHLLLGLAGALLTLRMAWVALAAARRGIATATTAARPRGSDFWDGVVIALLSPKQVAFWLGVGGGLAARSGPDPRAEALALFLAGFTAGYLIFTAGMVIMVVAGRRLLRISFHRSAQALCGAVLGLFGLRLLAGTLQLI